MGANPLGQRHELRDDRLVQAIGAFHIQHQPIREMPLQHQHRSPRPAGSDPIDAQRYFSASPANKTGTHRSGSGRNWVVHSVPEQWLTWFDAFSLLSRRSLPPISAHAPILVAVSIDPRLTCQSPKTAAAFLRNPRDPLPGFPLACSGGPMACDVESARPFGVKSHSCRVGRGAASPTISDAESWWGSHGTCGAVARPRPTR